MWASWGVDGLKIDFFENDSQHTMWQYNMLADLMIQYKLMINFHGSVKPVGEEDLAELHDGGRHYGYKITSGVSCRIPFITVPFPLQEMWRALWTIPPRHFPI
ncbi:MAG: glycoside hydrolase family 97 catalytic domain-containing protein [Eisenbergiella sp.]